MRRALAFAWRWSWVLTLPLLITFGFWLKQTVHRYWTFQVRHITSDDLSLRKVGAMECEHMLRGLQIGLTGRNLPTDSQLRTIQLFVPEESRGRLESNLPHSGFDYVDGAMVHAGSTYDVRLRYRGDNVYHWGYYKKSWRVRTRRSELFEGMRSFNLVAPRTPEVINNHLSHELGRMLGLITPRTELVNVVINGAYDGVYVLTEQLEESTLRDHDRMPGDIYSGEIIARDQPHGVESNLFRHAGLWEKVAVNNHFAEDSMAPLQALLRAVARARTDVGQQELLTLVDLDAFARFSLLEILTTTEHFDAVHNWRLFYDPWRNVFEPITWDPVGWHESTLPRAGKPTRLDVITSPLHEALHRNGEFLRRRQLAVQEFFATGKDRRLLRLVDDAIQSLRAPLANDPHQASRARLIWPDEALQRLQVMRAGIVQVLDEVRRGYLEGPGTLRHAAETHRFRLQVDGRRPAQRLAFRFLQAPARTPTATVAFIRDGRRELVDVTAALVLRDREIQLETPLLARLIPVIQSMQPGKVGPNHLTVRPAYYEVEFRGLPAAARAVDVMVDWGDGRLVPGEAVERVEPATFENVFGIVPPRPLTAPLVLQGDLLFSGVQVVPHETIIRPGTTLRMAPGASAIFHGRVIAEGTASEPIRFVPADPQRPWGAIGVRTRGADRTRFVHCIFEGGSGHKEPLAEYSAMLSIHDVRDVDVRHCQFRDSKVVDDMVHTVYADIRFEDCVFERSLSDALDLDISRGIMRRCRFTASGNDAVDLMTTLFCVEDSVFEGSGDKGISVGEGSTMLAVNNTFRRCNIGVQAKDGSVAVVANADFLENNLALDAYKKNWRYNAGGNLTVLKSRLVQNRRHITADKDSQIVLEDSFLDGVPEADPRQLTMQAVDARPEPAAAAAQPLPFPQQLRRLETMARPFWTRLTPSTRGVVPRGNQDR